MTTLAAFSSRPQRLPLDPVKPLLSANSGLERRPPPLPESLLLGQKPQHGKQQRPPPLQKSESEWRNSSCDFLPSDLFVSPN